METGSVSLRLIRILLFYFFSIVRAQLALSLLNIMHADGHEVTKLLHLPKSALLWSKSAANKPAPIFPQQRQILPARERLSIMLN